MNDPLLWFIILAAGFCTYLLRLSFIQLWERLSLPRWLHRALQYVPAAVLAALVLPALLRSGSGIDISPDNLRLLAGGLAAIVAWYSRSVLLTLAVGMGALWLLQALL